MTLHALKSHVRHYELFPVHSCLSFSTTTVLTHLNRGGFKQTISLSHFNLSPLTGLPYSDMLDTVGEITEKSIHNFNEIKYITTRSWAHTLSSVRGSLSVAATETHHKGGSNTARNITLLNIINYLLIYNIYWVNIIKLIYFKVIIKETISWY